MELVGKILGNRYEIIEKIGNGGMASVYRAKDKTLGRNVAIKVLKDEFANDQEFIKRFQIEAQSAASLSHPNIVSIYDVSNDNDTHYIVMELIEGQTLKDIINKEGKLDWKKSAEIASQIASGLSTAHKNHIIHRDIKPHNIVITKDGMAKITDFGIAKATTTSTINANSNSLGSVHYFSPEHARGGYTDEKSDIYSLGVVLYEMVTGKLPFDGDSAVGIAMKHLKEKPVPPKEISPDIPEGLNDIILKAMQKEVSNRYVSASSMYNDLQKVLKDPDVKEVGKVGKEDKTFATQRVPTITNASAIKAAAMKAESEKDGRIDKSKKKKKRRSNPIAVALVRLLLIILIFGGCVAGAYYGLNHFMGGSEEKALVPGVIGCNADTAKIKIEDAGFKFAIDGEEKSDFPKGYVSSQKFQSGDEVAKGTTITVKLSAGPSRVLVPAVVGDSERIAKMKLENVSLKVEVEEEENDEVPKGNVIRQNIEANSEVDADTVVTIFISTGPEDGLLVVPDLTSSDEARAIYDLETLGLVPRVTYDKDEKYPDGQIIEQLPVADTKVEPGTTVYLTINKLKEPEPETTEPAPITPTTPPPTNTPAQEPTKPAPVADNHLKVNVSNKGSRETFTVKVTLNGDIKGRTNIYEATHKRSDGVIDVPYPGDATGMLRVYIDGNLDSEMLIQ